MLRVATRAAHDRVDALFSGFDLARPADYRRFLLAQAAAFLPVERALDGAGVADLFPDWPARRRSPALVADCDALGLAAPAPLAAPGFDSPAEIVGAAYVLEGSRLGGAMLARSVGAGLPHAFLAASPVGGQWRAFLGQLEQLLTSDVQRSQAVKGATQVFDVFEQAARVAMEG